MKSNFEIDHIGIAVESIEEAFEFYKALGWTHMKTETVESEKVRVGFISFKNNVHIELLEATSPDSPVAKFIAKRGTGIHHICMKVPDIKKSMNNLKSAGKTLIYDQPQAGAKDCWITFVHPKSADGVLIELSQPLSGDK